MRNEKPVVNKAHDLIQLFQQKGKHAVQSKWNQGMMIVTADSSTSLIFEGSVNPVSIALFEIPAEYLPLEPFARYFALPIGEPNSQRWGLIQRLDNNGISGEIKVSNGTTSTTYTLQNGLFVAAN